MPSAVLQSASLVEALLDPKAYPHPVGDLSLLQTHASWLFFTGDRVYKVKKPVNYGFLDFSTLAKRRRYCRLETSLNRRLSPEVYLGVVEIRRLGGRVSVGGSAGEVVGYAVQMKRLPSRDSLAERLASGRLGIPEVRQIAAGATPSRTAESRSSAGNENSGSPTTASHPPTA